MTGANLGFGQRIKKNNIPFIYKNGTINKILQKFIFGIEAINISLILNKGGLCNSCLIIWLNMNYC